MTAAVVAF